MGGIGPIYLHMQSKRNMILRRSFALLLLLEVRNVAALLQIIKPYYHTGILK